MKEEHIPQYAALDNRADPDFIECKGYVHVGNSRDNLTSENMPWHEDILEFSNALAPLVNREVLDDSAPSRVSLIGKEIVPIPIPEPTMFFPDDLGIASPVKHLKVV
jgi:tRNA wybutosine-synthesizing protein 1